MSFEECREAFIGRGDEATLAVTLHLWLAREKKHLHVVVALLGDTIFS